MCLPFLCIFCYLLNNIQYSCNMIAHIIIIISLINDYLEQQLQLLYDYWFTQYNFPNEDGQPYKASNGLMVWNKMINHLIPADWKVKPLGTICSFRNGINYDKNVDGNTIRFFLTKAILMRYVFQSNKVINTMYLMIALSLPVVGYQELQEYYAIQVVI